MSDLIETITHELNVDRETALQGAGAIFSVVKERVGLRTFQMLRVPFPDVELWIDLHSGIEGYGAGDFFLKDLGFSGPAVDMIERATSSGVPLETAQKMFALIYRWRYDHPSLIALSAYFEHVSLKHIKAYTSSKEWKRDNQEAGEQFTLEKLRDEYRFHICVSSLKKWIPQKRWRNVSGSARASSLILRPDVLLAKMVCSPR